LFLATNNCLKEEQMLEKVYGVEARRNSVHVFTCSRLKC